MAKYTLYAVAMKVFPYSPRWAVDWDKHNSSLVRGMTIELDKYAFLKQKKPTIEMLADEWKLFKHWYEEDNDMKGLDLIDIPVGPPQGEMTGQEDSLGNDSA